MHPVQTAAPGAVRATCLNCDAPLTGDYCAACGQRDRPPVPALRDFLSEIAATVTSLDSRLARTLRTLLTRPGQLTVEYVAGRRRRYTEPAQLYLLAAAVFFLMASYRPFVWVDAESRSVAAQLPGMAIANPAADRRLVDLADPVEYALFAERFAGAIQQFLPLFLVASVVLFSLSVWAIQRKREPRYLPHAVFAVHWVSLYLILMAAARVFPAGWNLQDPIFLVAIVYLVLSLRRVYGQRVLPAIGTAWVLTIAFLLALALWIQAAIVLGVRSV